MSSSDSRTKLDSDLPIVVLTKRLSPPLLPLYTSSVPIRSVTFWELFGARNCSPLTSTEALQMIVSAANPWAVSTWLLACSKDLTTHRFTIPSTRNAACGLKINVCRLSISWLLSSDKELAVVPRTIARYSHLLSSQRLQNESATELSAVLGVVHRTALASLFPQR